MNKPEASRPSADIDIYRLWDELADFDSNAGKEALLHCLRTLCDWIGAQDAYWVGIIRMSETVNRVADPAHGWRIGGAEFLRPERITRQHVDRGMKLLHSDDPGALVLAVLAGAGAFRSLSMLSTDLIDLEAFQKTEHYHCNFRLKDIADYILVAFPISADAESIFCFNLKEAGRSFSPVELQLVSDTLRGIKWFHLQMLLNHNLGVGKSPLTPAERRLLPGLLSGGTEGAIAEQLDLTRGTVHQYATSIYRKYGVSGRTEFMAIWLRGRL